MKGLELPINIIVIIAVAVLVFTVIAAFFTGALSQGVNTIAVENAFQKGCQLAKTVESCNSISFPVSGYRQTEKGIQEDPAGSVQFSWLCGLKGAANDQTKCLRLCGCAV